MVTDVLLTLATMMWQLDGQKELFSYAVDLDRRIHADHPLRRVRQMIDFNFARDLVAHTYGANGKGRDKESGFKYFNFGLTTETSLEVRASFLK